MHNNPYIRDKSIKMQLISLELSLIIYNLLLATYILWFIAYHSSLMS